MELIVAATLEVRKGGIKNITFEHLQSKGQVRITIRKSSGQEVLPLIQPDWMAVRDAIDLTDHFFGDALGESITMVAIAAKTLLAAKATVGTPEALLIGINHDPNWLMDQWCFLGASPQLTNIFVNWGETPASWAELEESEIRLGALKDKGVLLTEAVVLRNRLQG